MKSVPFAPALRPLWQRFTQSASYRQLEVTYPADQIRAAVGLLGSAMTAVTPLPPASWHVFELAKGLNHLAGFLNRATTNPEAVTALLEIAQAFLLVAASANLIGLTPGEVVSALRPHHAAAKAAVTRPGQLDVIEDPRLPSFHEATYVELITTAQAWVDRFLVAPIGRKQTLSADLCGLLLTALVEAGYKWRRKTPQTWTPAMLQETMVDLFACELPIDRTTVGLVAPLLRNFLTFVGKQGWLRPEVVGRDLRAVDGAVPEMTAAAADPERWHPRKRVVMAMVAAGIDLSDEAAVRRFAQRYEEVQAVHDALHLPRFAQSPLVYQPDDRHQDLPHVETAGDRRWTKATATRMHNAGIDAARLVWSDTANAALREQVDQQKAVLAVAAWYDGLYATALQTPKRWSAAAAGPVLAGLRRTADFEAYRTVLLALISQLGRHETLTPQQVTELSALLRPFATPTADSGKIISLASVRARKMQRHR
ncbi:hypothetical protein [Lacticaseibacillus kribbianus]|uniref:hypothetical protein n=1 Tax=Lacticaseibacillus kribbianus TaxID=2926292 RepID=UPI001CD74264|nr:hypothetical protein [Lacticaseibacillus kribbianus]